MGYDAFMAFVSHMFRRSNNQWLYKMIGKDKNFLFPFSLCLYLFQMTKVTKEHCLEIVAKFEPCPENQKQGVLGIDGKM